MSKLLDILYINVRLLTFFFLTLQAGNLSSSILFDLNIQVLSYANCMDDVSTTECLVPLSFQCVFTTDLTLCNSSHKLDKVFAVFIFYSFLLFILQLSRNCFILGCYSFFFPFIFFVSFLSLLFFPLLFFSNFFLSFLKMLLHYSM